jgi:hypothetical protein
MMTEVRDSLIKNVMRPLSREIVRRHTSDFPSQLTCNQVVDSPHGFPRLAALQSSSADLTIFRHFKTAHCRVLIHLQCDITSIEKQLDELDISDSKSKCMRYRLHQNEWHEGWDTTQKDLLKKLRTKLIIYGKISVLESKGS